MTLEFLNPAIGADMAAVDRVLRESLASDVVLIRQVAETLESTPPRLPSGGAVAAPWA